MNVLCLDAKTRIQECDLVEGNTYEVLSENGCGDRCCYKIKKGGVSVWAKDRFIPVSDIDETELVNHKEELHA